jgi:ribosomal protein L44E
MKILPKKKRKLSKNRRAEIILGKRNLPPGSIPFDQPCELGYHCPVCKYEHFRVNQMTWDERLHWSEYEGFIWCSVCNKDYPSCVCYNAQSNIPDYVYRVNPDCKTYADLSIKVFLDTIEEAINRKEKQREKVEKPIKRKNKTYGGYPGRGRGRG